MQDVVLHVHSKQHSDGQVAKMEQQYQSKGAAKPGGWYFTYVESVADVGEVRTVLKVGVDEVTILRQGPLEMKQRFQSGMDSESIYHSPFGRFRMKVYTRRLRVTHQENRPLAVDLAYQLWLNEAYVGEVELAFRFAWQ
ncbi:DUF1934 domain-containing protein [Brevibacillus marinus]|uniref:DUF1934 domain-containing protein n=1 Tax=Brevibacillus marinus TaxID=2496837 RepID=UPI000F83C9C6|nr:DUF1934 domain-containing protein [Brevibacillus marinus]